MTTQLCSMSLRGCAIFSSPKVISCCVFLLLEVATSLLSLKFKKLNEGSFLKKKNLTFPIPSLFFYISVLHTKFSLRNLFPFKFSLSGLAHLDFYLTPMLCFLLLSCLGSSFLLPLPPSSHISATT